MGKYARAPDTYLRHAAPCPPRHRAWGACARTPPSTPASAERHMLCREVHRNSVANISGLLRLDIKHYAQHVLPHACSICSADHAPRAPAPTSWHHKQGTPAARAAAACSPGRSGQAARQASPPRLRDACHGCGRTRPPLTLARPPRASVYANPALRRRLKVTELASRKQRGPRRHPAGRQPILSTSCPSRCGIINTEPPMHGLASAAASQVC